MEVYLPIRYDDIVQFASNIVGEYVSTTCTTSNQACSSSGPEPRIDHISLHFSHRKVFREYWLSDIDTSTELVAEQQEPTISTTVRFPYQTLLNTASEQDTIKNELRGWNVSEDTIQGLIDDVLCQTRQLVRVARPGYNGLELLIETTAVYEYVFKRRDIVDVMTRLHSIEESASNHNMVPATDSSMELLKRKIIMGCDEESCLICLEEFDCNSEALSMPCSHAFHGDCIGKWLRTSHYCPICRYEMPTN